MLQDNQAYRYPQILKSVLGRLQFIRPEDVGRFSIDNCSTLLKTYSHFLIFIYFSTILISYSRKKSNGFHAVYYCFDLLRWVLLSSEQGKVPLTFIFIVGSIHVFNKEATLFVNFFQNLFYWWQHKDTNFLFLLKISY